MEQIEVLKTKLEEYRDDHEQQESSIQDDIISRNDTLSSVQESVERRKKTLEISEYEVELALPCIGPFALMQDFFPVNFFPVCL